MVGGGHHEDTVVVLEAVDFVEEVGACRGGDDGVDVLEDEHAGGHSAGLQEDGADVVGAWGGFDVEGWDGAGAEFVRGGEGVHEGFDGDGFSVAYFLLSVRRTLDGDRADGRTGRTVEDHAPFPWDPEGFVDIFALEESGHEIDERFLHLGIQDHIIPSRFLHLLPERLAGTPVPIVHVDEIIINRMAPSATCHDQRIHRLGVRQGRLIFSGLFQDEIVGTIAEDNDIENEELARPMILVFGEIPAFVDAFDIAVAGISGQVAADAIYGFVGEIQIGCGMTGGGEIEQGWIAG